MDLGSDSYEDLATKIFVHYTEECRPKAREHKKT